MLPCPTPPLAANSTMKQPVAIVTDSSCGLPPAVLEELGVVAATGNIAFDHETVAEQLLSGSRFYERMARESRCPRPFGVPENAWREAFARAYDSAASILCLVAPFGPLPDYTTATAAISAMDTRDIKLVNPGIASAGLGALLLSLAPVARSGATMDALLDAIEGTEPASDVLLVPRETCWLDLSGRLGPIEERLGPLEGRIPVVRVSSRITGVTACDSFDRAIDETVERVGQRAAGRVVNVVVTHADSPQIAERTVEKMTQRWKTANIVIGELGPTIGSQLGPGAVGIGVAPAKLEQL